jgi:nitrite reductase/ring-hydroxylating ferredoxin subunit
MRLFRRQRADADGFWDTGISAESVQPDQIVTVTLGAHDVIVTRLADGLVAFSATCPHAAADLSEGSLHRGRITCPEHGWKFDIRTGRTLWPEDEMCRLQRFELQEMAGLLKIKTGEPQ